MNSDFVVLSEDRMKELSADLLEWGEENDLTPHQFSCLMYHLSLYVAGMIDFNVEETLMRKPNDKVN